MSQYPDVSGDRRLLRFYRGHGGDIAKTCEMIKKFLDWRKENNIDAIRNSIVHGGMFVVGTVFAFYCICFIFLVNDFKFLFIYYTIIIIRVKPPVQISIGGKNSRLNSSNCHW